MDDGVECRVGEWRRPGVPTGGGGVVNPGSGVGIFVADVMPSDSREEQ